jgi:alpha-D-xyloside xylohydrolase
MSTRSSSVAILLAALLLVLSSLAFAQAPVDKPSGLRVELPGGTLTVSVISDRIVRVSFSRDKSFVDRPVLDVVPQTGSNVDVRSASSGDLTTIITGSLQVVVNKKTGAVRFLDLKGSVIASEVVGGRTIEPAEVQGEKTFHVQQRWVENADESLYGLGQMQLGAVDIKGLDLDLWQRNTNIVVPFLVSSRGYGIFWENLSLTRFGDLRQFVPIPVENLLDADGKPGGLTVRPLDGSQPAKQSGDLMLDFLPQGKPDPAPKDTRWEGFLSAPVSGDYQFQSYYNGGTQALGRWPPRS